MYGEERECFYTESFPWKLCEDVGLIMWDIALGFCRLNEEFVQLLISSIGKSVV